MNILALIPARGGSKSIPLKNMIPLCGKPLISYVIDAAKRSKNVNRIVVSTENEEIVRYSLQMEVEIVERPANLANDETPVLPVLKHAIGILENDENYRPDVIVLLQPTSPFTRPENIDDSVDLLVNNSADSVCSIANTPHNYHPFNMRIIQDGRVRFHMPDEKDKHPTKQTKPKFYKFGNLITFRYDTLMTKNSLYGDVCLPLLVDRISAFDLDDSVDLEIANRLCKD